MKSSCSPSLEPALEVAIPIQQSCIDISHCPVTCSIPMSLERSAAQRPTHQMADVELYKQIYEISKAGFDEELDRLEFYDAKAQIV